MGTGTGACSVVSVLPSDSLLQCLLTAVFASGQILFGGAAPLPEVGVVTHFGILGGTGEFRKARGEATLAVISPTLQDAVFDLQRAWPGRHGLSPDGARALGCGQRSNCTDISHDRHPGQDVGETG